MMRSRIFLFCLLVFVVLFQCGVILFQARKLEETKLIRDHVKYEDETKTYLIINNTKEYVGWLTFNDDGTLYQCAVNDQNGVRLSFLLAGDVVNFGFEDLNRHVQTVQYYNLTRELLLHRQEVIGDFSRYSQLLSDGTVQQKKWNPNKKEWELEFPVNGTWKDVETQR